MSVPLILSFRTDGRAGRSCNSGRDFAQLRDEHFNDKIRTGTIVDISGGGIRFNSDTELKSGDHILAVAHLANERMNQNSILLVLLFPARRRNR